MPEETRDIDAPWISLIKATMKAKGINQESLAPVIGVETRGAVGHYLTQRRNLSIEQLRSLILYLQLDPAEALGLSETDHSETQSCKTALTNEDWQAIREFIEDRLKIKRGAR